MERFIFIEKRGEGTFAEVWEVQDKHSGKRAALKILKKRFASAVEVFQDAEFRTLKTFSSKPNSNSKPAASGSSVPFTPMSGSPTKRSESLSSGAATGLLLGSSLSTSLSRPSVVDSGRRGCRRQNSGASPPVAADKSNLFHPHLTGLHDAFFEPREGKVVFVLELLGKSLLDEIMDRKAARTTKGEQVPRPMKMCRTRHPLFTEGELRVILFQILSGVFDMHCRQIFHRDIKPENILFQIPSSQPSATENSTLKLKLADFGSCQFSCLPVVKSDSTFCGSASAGSTEASVAGGVSPEESLSPADPLQQSFIAYTEYIATRWYRSPECLLTSGHYGPPMDLWATGCVAVELLTGHPFFPGENEVHQLQLIHAMFGCPSRSEVEKYIGPVGIHLSAGHSFASSVQRRSRGARDGGNAASVQNERVLSPSRVGRDGETSSSSQRGKPLRYNGGSLKCRYRKSATETETADVNDMDTPSFPSVSHWRTRIVPKIVGGNISDSLSDLLHRLLAYYPNERVTAKVALQHAFFSDVY